MFVGSSLGKFIDSKIRTDGKVIELKPSNEQLKKGNTTYYSPGIVVRKKNDKILQSCKDMDEELQLFFDLKKGVKNEDINNAQNEHGEEKDDFPF